MTIENERVRALNEKPAALGGRYVLYWMQQSQRSGFNPALEFAVREANRAGLPVAVCFGLTDRYPEANARHYAFMLSGLAEVARRLAERGIAFRLRRGDPAQVALAFAAEAHLIVCDCGYLRPQKAWRDRLARDAPCAVLQVEADVVIPVDLASGKHEFAARTLRPKLLRELDRFLIDLPEAVLAHRETARLLATRDEADLDPADPAGALASLQLDRSVVPVRRFRGGREAGLARLRAFLADGLVGYAERRGVPTAGAASHLSPYLHFGQLSPVEIALQVRAAGGASAEDRDTFIDELVVRRELAMNHVHREPAYDRWEGLPAWARKTLEARANDERPTRYERSELERGETADDAWNAAMKEMRETGYMHNHLRMYWGKKILEWSEDPREAFETVLYLNNRYFLDGRDANSYTNVSWIFGLHDRPFFDRPIYGLIRPMSRKSLDRKIDVPAYIAAVDALAGEESG